MTAAQLLAFHIFGLSQGESSPSRSDVEIVRFALGKLADAVERGECEEISETFGTVLELSMADDPVKDAIAAALRAGME